MSTWEELRGEALVVEDEAVLALNKPAGIAVTGEGDGSDLVGISKVAGEELLPVHRIDKVTSGLILFAKTPRAHALLTRQFNARAVAKTYLAITASTGLPASGRVELPLSEGRKGRVRVAAPREAIVADLDAGRWYVRDEDVLDTRTYASTTGFTVLWSDGRWSVLEVTPVTGRRHQIRVHLAWIGHPILGDPLFDKGAGGRTCLHSWKLAFDAAWRGGERMAVSAEPGADFWDPVGGPPPGAGAQF